MGLSELLLGAGIAILVALLGWGNQIKDFQNETKRLEVLFAKKLGTKYRYISKITSRLDSQTIQDEFVSMIKSVKKIIEKDKKNITNNLKHLNKLSKIEMDFEKIKSSYYKKYELTLELAMVCLAAGVIMLSIELTLDFPIRTWAILFALFPLFWICKIINLLIDIHKREKRFQKTIDLSDREISD